MIRENVMAGNKCIETSQHDPLKNLADGAKKADWAIVLRVLRPNSRWILKKS
jgi:hypothetical protein